jgi:hypothetical protein
MRSITFPIPFMALGLVAGCGAAGRVPVFPVQGQVLFNGKPAAGAQVVFHPAGKTGSDALRPTAQVDADGKFTLTTFTSGDGAPAGEYEVTVEQWVSKNDDPAVNVLPARYRQVRTSGLRVTIAANENQVPTIKLAR